MFELFYPDEECASAYKIDYAACYAKGYRGVIFDIDNTLVPHGAPADAAAIALFTRLHAAGFETMLLSNNKEPRVKSFAQAVNTGYIYKAGKPKRKNYRTAMVRMNTRPETTLFVGDQIFTDTWGAQMTGIHTILVRPIHPKEEIQIVLKRYLEAVVLYCYHRKKRREAEKSGKQN